MKRRGTPDIKVRFGLAVRRRHELGLSQEALGERADLHRTYIADIERGVRNISLVNIEKLARALDLPIWVLFANYGVEAHEGPRRCRRVRGCWQASAPRTC
jgi:transcriptional regulator with XRE-family HTH domain